MLVYAFIRFSHDLAYIVWCGMTDVIEKLLNIIRILRKVVLPFVLLILSAIIIKVKVSLHIHYTPSLIWVFVFHCRHSKIPFYEGHPISSDNDPIKQ